MAQSPLHFSQERLGPQTNSRCRTLTKTARSRANPKPRRSRRPLGQVEDVVDGAAFRVAGV